MATLRVVAAELINHIALYRTGRILLPSRVVSMDDFDSRYETGGTAGFHCGASQR